MTALCRGSTFFLASLFACGALLAEVPDPNHIPNWAAPATWSPHGASGGITTMTDLSPAIPFVPITPCRIADTRAGMGFSGTQGPPALTTSARTIDVGGTVVGVPAQCGIPTSADAVSFQFTIVGPNTAGNLVAWPAGGVAPTISVLNWSAGESALGNGTIVPLGTGAGINVQINAAVGSATGELVVDVNGYFASIGNAGTGFSYQTTDTIRAAFIENNNLMMGDGLLVEANSITNGDAGIIGQALGATGETYGVYGQNNSGSQDSAGVFGTANVDTNPVITPNAGYAGVRGESSAFGVLGFAESRAVGGYLVNSVGVILASGVLGSSDGTDPGSGAPPWGVFASGDIGATGFKHFLDPHPTDPSVVIAYVSLEGPEAGTYFRGKGRFQNGTARIPVPEHFRLVTDPEGLTVQVTPIGAVAPVGVLKMDLNEIVVSSSRNVEFSYLVQGVRATHRDLNPLRRSGEFAPESAEAKMPAWLSPEQKRRLVQNGTYREDGTVNPETAQRLGWDRVWERRERPAPQPESP